MILPPHDEKCPATLPAGFDCLCPRGMAKRYVELNLAGLSPLIYSIMMERAQARIITSLEGHASAIANEIRKRIEEQP